MFVELSTRLWVHPGFREVNGTIPRRVHCLEELLHFPGVSLDILRQEMLFSQEGVLPESGSPHTPDPRTPSSECESPTMDIGFRV